jgi:cell division protein FtsW
LSVLEFYFLLLFLLPKLFPILAFFSRVTTWEKPIENFSTDKPDEDDYQIEKLKLLLHLEDLWTWSWESVQKNFCRNPRLILFMPL